MTVTNYTLDNVASYVSEYLAGAYGMPDGTVTPSMVEAVLVNQDADPLREHFGGSADYVAKLISDAAEERDRLAQETAEHIAAKRQPTSSEGITIIGDEGRPTDIPAIKAALLDGHMWISWMDDVTTTAMRQLHGEPQGEAAWLAGDDAA